MSNGQETQDTGPASKLDWGKSLPLPGTEDPVREAGRTGKVDPKAFERVTAAPKEKPVEKKPELDFSKSIKLPAAQAPKQAAPPAPKEPPTPQARQASEAMQTIEKWRPRWDQPGQILQDPTWYGRSARYAGGELIGTGKAGLGVAVGGMKMLHDVADMMNPMEGWRRGFEPAKEVGRDIAGAGKAVMDLGKDVYDMGAATWDFIKHNPVAMADPEKFGNDAAQLAMLVDGAYKVADTLGPKIKGNPNPSAGVARLGQTPAGKMMGIKAMQDQYVFTKGLDSAKQISRAAHQVSQAPPAVSAKFTGVFGDLMDNLSKAQSGGEVYKALTKDPVITGKLLENLDKYGLDSSEVKDFIKNTGKVIKDQARFKARVFGIAYGAGLPVMIAARSFGATWLTGLGMAALGGYGALGLVAGIRALSLHPDIVWAILDDYTIPGPGTGQPPTPPPTTAPPGLPPPTPAGPQPPPGPVPTGRAAQRAAGSAQQQGPPSAPPPAPMPQAPAPAAPSPSAAPSPTGRAAQRMAAPQMRPPQAPPEPPNPAVVAAAQQGAERAAAPSVNLDLLTTQQLLDQLHGVRPPGFEKVMKLLKENKIDDEQFHSYLVHSARELIERQRNVAHPGGPGEPGKPRLGPKDLPKSVTPKYAGPERRAGGETEPRAKLVHPDQRTLYYELKKKLETATGRDKEIIQQQIDDILEHPFGEKKLPYDVKSAKKPPKMTKEQAEAETAKRKKGQQARAKAMMKESEGRPLSISEKELLKQIKKEGED